MQKLKKMILISSLAYGFWLMAYSIVVAATMTLTGLDVLEREGFKQLAGKRVGILTNHSSVDSAGRNAVDALRAGGVNIAAIISPEHGFRGTAEHGVLIENSTDPAAGAPIFSLYGKTKRPTAEMLKAIDILVFDIQDIGARFYTYLTTMAYAMEEAARYNVEFMVLDRPNPVGGDILEGPVLDSSTVNALTAYFPVPVRHGFTAGEMALFHKDWKDLDLKLTVVKMEGWRREMFFDETAVVWTNPSPNIRSVKAEILYPGLGCFEATNVAVGRGTDTPFHWFGAPWMKAAKIAKKLSAAPLKGAAFRAETRTPDKDVYAGEKCSGVAVDVIDPAAVRALDIYVYAAYYLRKYNRKDFIIKAEEIKKMTGNSRFYEMLEAGEEPAAILAGFEKDSAAFRTARTRFLLY